MICRFPDYQNCGLNVISSIARYFGAENRHTTLPALDGLLQEKPYRKIVLFLLDGLGMDALAHDCPPDSFFNTHIFRELSAVYPSTTTAATTSIETDYAPGEHGWLGWTLYFHEINQLIAEQEAEAIKAKAEAVPAVTFGLPIPSPRIMHARSLSESCAMNSSIVWVPDLTSLSFIPLSPV